MPIYDYSGNLELKFCNIHKQIDYFKDSNFANPDHNVTWADPIGTVMLEAHSELYKVPLDKIPTNGYITKMMTQGIDSQSSSYSTYTPIALIQGRFHTEKIRDSLTATIMKNFAGLSPINQDDLKKYLNHMFSELMNNVSDHSHSDIGGYAMAQYYPQHKKVQFAIADKGCGFLENIQAKYPNITTEEDAILKAMERAVTASKNIVYGQTRNMGYGLYTLETILNATHGKMIIISNDKMMKLENGKKSVLDLSTNWEGVVVAFEFLEEHTEYEFETIQRRWLEEGSEEEEEDFFL